MRYSEYADHSTANRLGIQPQAKIIHGNKFLGLGTILEGDAAEGDGFHNASVTSDNDTESSELEEGDFDHAVCTAMASLFDAEVLQSNNAWLPPSQTIVLVRPDHGPGVEDFSH